MHLRRLRKQLLISKLNSKIKEYTGFWRIIAFWMHIYPLFFIFVI